MEELERFGLTEEEQMLQDMVRRLTKEKVAPGAEERDAKGEYPYDMLELMKENKEKQDVFRYKLLTSY